jgi:penicillin V acylase-like amidase (Ntn superfamily)
MGVSSLFHRATVCLCLLYVLFAAVCHGCSDFYMNFSAPDIRLSVRTMDLGLDMTNWTFTSWPVGMGVDFTSSPPFSMEQATQGTPIKYAMLGVSANWFGDNHWGFPTFFGDSINEMGLSCSLLTLVGTKYEHYSVDKRKTNVFAGSFCKWATSQHPDVLSVQAALDDVVIYGPDLLAEHFILRDANGLR